MISPQNWAQVNLAAERVERNIESDSKFNTLADLLRANPQQPSLSGLQDIDYPNMLNLSHRIPLVSKISTVPLPTEVLEQYVNMKHDCALGIFPEISRAWLSVDSSIFFWAYDNASDVAYYDGLEETIIAVHLFKPKANVFKSHIKHLLCLITASEITLLGVTCSDEGPNSLTTVLLIPDPIFKLPTDNVVFSVLAGTDDGRIFMGGNDGCLYEIVYQAEDGWFSRKCRKVNHSYSLLSYVTPAFLTFSDQEPIVQIEIDNSRKLLYAKTEKSSIQMYSLGSDGYSVRLITTKTLTAIVNQASCIARTIDTSNFKPIVSIKPITHPESDNIYLVAVTEAGVRLYFTACGECNLDLVHLRLPPGFTPSSAMQRPNLVSTIYHKDSAFIMTSSQTDNKDFLWVLSNDYYVYEDQMMEAFTVNSLGGRVWCIAEETRPPMQSLNREKQNPPLVVKQHFEERRKFILLTSDGVHIFHKYRPIDQLHLLLAENQGPESPAVRSFFQSTKLTEACLTSLILASSSNLPQEKQLVEWATLAFFRYGGEPRLIKSLGLNGTYMPSMSTPISSPNLSSIGLNVSPIAARYNSTMALGAEQVDIQFSARHDAVYLYLSRILRPIWRLNAATTEIFEKNLKILRSSVAIEEISLYLKRATELKRFLDANIQAVADQAKLSQTQTSLRGNDVADSMTMERESLNSMIILLSRTIEVLNLYKLLYEHEFSTVCTNIPAEPQQRLSSMTFRDLIVVGNEMTTSIASALVRRYLDDNITTDAISRKLHELCPSIFRQENALQAKAHEMILQSRAIIDKSDKEKMMSEAVSLLKKIGVRLDLQAICDLLHSARAHKYIVDICLFVAEKRDPTNAACFQQQRFPNNSIEDIEERARATVLNHRMDCYMKIIDTLDRLLNSDDFDEVFASCVKSSDELFHTKLYEWLCEKNLLTRLLDVQSPYVEPFLKKKAESDNYSTNYLDLMWKFYEKRRNYSSAAQILDKLACRPCTDYGLDERLEYLSRAKGCVEALATPGEFSHDLEEKIEVARIQIQIFKKLRELPESPVTQEALTHLNYSLLDLTQLFANYAQKFGLYDCQLAILKCGNHYDPSLIEKLWTKIIDNVLEKNLMESPDTQLHILSNKVESLGKMLMPSERFFPVYFIIAYLEHKTHKFGNLSWVPHCLIKIGFKPINLLEPYHKFYKSREHSTFWSGKSVHVLQVMAVMIEKSLNKADKAFASACLDVICDYLIDLQTMATTDSEVKQLQQKFTLLQSKTNQLLN